MLSPTCVSKRCFSSLADSTIALVVWSVVPTSWVLDMIAAFGTLEGIEDRPFVRAPPGHSREYTASNKSPGIAAGVS